jgi:hypothetical protein
MKPQQTNKDELLDQPWVISFIEDNLRSGSTVLEVDYALCRIAEVMGYNYKGILKCLANASIFGCPYFDVDWEQEPGKPGIEFTFHLQSHPDKITRRTAMRG